MLEDIIAAAAASDYDFRRTASVSDPLQDDWPNWVQVFRLKVAVAQVLQPDTIFEVGVRYGYGARAFLEGAPNASYLGVDNDSETFGGVPGSVGFARELLVPFNADVVVADIYAHGIPGFVDLVHLDGPQGEEDWFWLLDQCFAQGVRFALIDGYLFAEENFVGVSSWLRARTACVSWWGCIPLPFGDLLIRFVARG